MNKNKNIKFLYLLDSDVDRKKLNDYDFQKSEVIAFDFLTHKFLNEKKIHHSIIDDHIDDCERIDIFKSCRKNLQEYEKITNSGINFHNLDLVSIVDRNELLEFLMQTLPKILVIKKFLENNNYEKIFLSHEMYEVFNNAEFGTCLEKLNDAKKNYLTFENIHIPLKIGNQEIKFSINRKKYKILKENIEKISGILFNLKNNMKEKKKIILLEFDPEIYSELLNEINLRGFQPILINFRKSPMHSITAIKNLKKSNSMVITPEIFLEKDDLKSLIKTKKLIQKTLTEILESKKLFLNLISKETNFDLLIQNKIIKIISQRLEEYLFQILISEKIKTMNNIKSIIVLNFSGETEKTFSKTQDKIPIILLQHAFANYLEPISHFDMLDDYHLIKNKIAVWGEIVKNYLIEIRKIPENKIIISVSPKYDSYLNSLNYTNDKKIILVTLRPIIFHMEGMRIKLFERYEKIIQELFVIFQDIDDVEILFKLHPQQNLTNQFITNMIKTNKKFKILQFNPIKELLSNCNIHINIAPENFDASSVILEAMILKKPTLNIQLQKNDFNFTFNTCNAIKSVSYDSDIKNAILDLLNNSKKDNLIENSQIYLSKYMKHMGTASKKLVDEIETF